MIELHELIARLEELGIEYEIELQGDRVKVVYDAYLLPGVRRAVGVRTE